MNQSKEMVRLAVEALDEKKGEDVKIIDIQGVISYCRLFCTGKRIQQQPDPGSDR